jgi:prefoldin subunit 5
LPPAARSGAHARPPSTTKSGPTETGTVNVSGLIGTTGPIKRQEDKDALPGVHRTPTPKVIAAATPAPVTPKKSLDKLALDESGEATEVDPGAHLTVPVGEFDHGGTHLDKDKLRVAYEQSTMKRDAANALLGLPEQPQTVVKEPPVEILLGETAAQLTRGDATSIDPMTAKFERGDPTAIGGDSTTITPPDLMPGAGGKLRAHATLRRKRGIGGDVRYVVTVLFGVRKARRELDVLEGQQATRQKSRARHLLTLGRAAVGSEGYDHPALAKARESLAVVEDERAQHAAQVTTADSELLRVRNDRAERAKVYAERIAALDAELTEVTKKLEPLEKESASSTRKAAELQESLRRIDAQIAATEASKHSVKKTMDPASIQAEIASLKADRLAVTRDEPRIAAELDALNPRIAALEARRTEARKKRQELDEDEKKDQGRVQELLAAIGAKRKVVDRAAVDAEEARDKILLELGERIYVDRPSNMTFELAPIDAIDVELGVTDRRMMELREIISTVDKAKLARGIALIILVTAALGTLTFWMLYEFS